MRIKEVSRRRAGLVSTEMGDRPRVYTLYRYRLSI